MASASIPAARTRRASLSVARSPTSTPILEPRSEEPRGRFEHGGLARARRPHQVHDADVVLAKMVAVVARCSSRCSPGCARARRPERCRCRRIHRSHTSRHLQLECWSTISSPATICAGRSQNVTREPAPRHDVAMPASGQAHRSATSSTSSGARSHSVWTLKISKAVRRSSTSTPAARPIRTRTRCTDHAFRSVALASI